MNVEGQYNPKDVECIPVETLEVLPSGADWQSRHLESERRKAEIRDRIHIYGMFYRFGLIDMPDKVNGKMKRAGRQM